MKFFNTFRGKLLLILTFLLMATLGVQYYLNLVTQGENNDRLEAQTRALVAGIALGSNGITSGEYMQDLIDRNDQTFFDQAAAERIKDVIIIDNSWQISDSLNPDYLPSSGADGETVYKRLADLKELPPLMERSRLGADVGQFPNQRIDANKNTDDEAHAVPIETSKGRWYVMVLLKNDKSAAQWRAARPLVYTLGVLLVSSLITLFTFGVSRGPLQTCLMPPARWPTVICLSACPTQTATTRWAARSSLGSSLNKTLSPGIGTLELGSFPLLD